MIFETRDSVFVATPFSRGRQRGAAYSHPAEPPSPLWQQPPP